MLDTLPTHENSDDDSKPGRVIDGDIGSENQEGEEPYSDDYQDYIDSHNPQSIRIVGPSLGNNYNKNILTLLPYGTEDLHHGIQIRGTSYEPDKVFTPDPNNNSIRTIETVYRPEIDSIENLESDTAKRLYLKAIATGEFEKVRVLADAFDIINQSESLASKQETSQLDELMKMLNEYEGNYPDKADQIREYIFPLAVMRSSGIKSDQIDLRKLEKEAFNMVLSEKGEDKRDITPTHQNPEV